METTLHNLGSLSYSTYNVGYKIQRINTDQKITKKITSRQKWHFFQVKIVFTESYFVVGTQ